MHFLEDFGQKKCFFFVVKNSVSWAKVHYCMVCSAYKLDFQICNFAQKQCICRENSNYAPNKSFVAIFAFAQRLPTSGTLNSAGVYLIFFKLAIYAGITFVL